MGNIVEHKTRSRRELANVKESLVDTQRLRSHDHAKDESCPGIVAVEPARELAGVAWAERDEWQR